MPLIDLAKVKKLDLIGWINSLPQFAKVCCLDWDIAFFFLPKMRQTDSLMEVWSKRRNESAENHAYRKWDRPTHWWRSGMRNATPIAEATRSYRSEQTGTNRRASGQRWPSWNIFLDYSNHLNTGLVRYSNGWFVSGCQMVQYTNDGLKTGLKKPVYGPNCLVFKWSVKSCDFTIWIPDTPSVWYSNESSIRVSGIQMVTVI